MGQFKIEDGIEIRQTVSGAGSGRVGRKCVLDHPVKFNVVERPGIQIPAASVSQSVGIEVVPAVQRDITGCRIPVGIEAGPGTTTEASSPCAHVDDNVDVVSATRTVPIDDDVFPLLNHSIDHAASDIGIRAESRSKFVGVVERVATIGPGDRRKKCPILERFQAVRGR